MSWMQTYTGIPFDLTSVSKDLVHQQDIVVALSRQPRFNGHTRHTISVAQHSCLVGKMIEANGGSPDLILAGYLHDGHEAYMSDIPSPIKWHLGEAWQAFKAVESKVDQAIAEYFDIDVSLFQDPLLKQADGSALWHEKHALMNDNGEEWSWDLILHGMSPLPLPHETWKDYLTNPWSEKVAAIELGSEIDYWTAYKLIHRQPGVNHEEEGSRCKSCGLQLGTSFDCDECVASIKENSSPV
jgi:hypothetical protein